MLGVLKRNRHLAHVHSFRAYPVVFLTIATARRRPILASVCVHQILRDIWTRSRERDGWHVGDYIIMPDHIHLFARPALDTCSLQRWIGMWKSVTARQIADTLSVRPPIWQADYFDRYLRSRESYSAKWTYVEQNAVRAGLVRSTADWPYKGTINTLIFR